MAGMSSDERRRLDELADDLARDNPQLARALTGRRYPAGHVRARWNRCRIRRRRGRAPDLLAVILALSGPPLLSIGVLLTESAVIAAGALALVGGPALFTVLRLRNSRREPRTRNRADSPNDPPSTLPSEKYPPPSAPEMGDTP